MAIELTDDGTMDTVLRCSECGEEFRFNFDPGPESDERAEDLREEIQRTNPHWTANHVTGMVNENLYNEFIASCIEETEAEHVCETNPREKGDDDGMEYGDPRDYRDGLE